jgi:SAM-dependent methyltransferase
MGFDANGIRFLLYVKGLGVDFSKTATIGRQGLHISRRELGNYILGSGIAIDEGMMASMFGADPAYAERFLQVLGAREIDSFDCSSYESATIIHDMNLPAPENLKEQYSLVIDGGSLEHVFNYPTAIKNCLEFVRPGGHFVAINPANNFLGHGFYQFSPELYFRILVPDNGFEIRQVLLAEDKNNSKWWKARDPAKVQCRGTLVNDCPTMMFVLAKKIASIVPLRKSPQQSDYVAAWSSSFAEAAGRAPLPISPGGAMLRLRRAAKGIVPPFVWRFLFSPYKRKFFEEIDICGNL